MDKAELNKHKMVEAVTAKMYFGSGVSVRKNVRLPACSSQRKREIDVLVSGRIAGNEVRIAIECKDEKRPIDASKIDAFIGKLQDVGVPPQLGIFVSASGYTNGAIGRAQNAGLKVLEFKNISSVDIIASVDEAIQTVVILMPEIREMTVVNSVQHAESSEEMLEFFNEHDACCGSLPDLIWLSWKKGWISTKVGMHLVNIALPSNWHQVINGNKILPSKLHARVAVKAFVASVTGDAQQFILIEPKSSMIERTHISLNFARPEKGLPFSMIDSPDLLEAYKKDQKAKHKVLFEYRMPRIICNFSFWPPSEKAVKAIAEMISKGIPREQVSLFDIEGDVINSAFDPVWAQYEPVLNLALKDIDRNVISDRMA